MQKTALILTAHADDAEFFAGGFMAAMIAEGWQVHEVIATDNSKGSYELGAAELVAQSRDREARAVAAFLGKASVDFLGYPDGDLTPLNHLELRGHFIRAIRKLKPQRVVTFDAYAPFELHPDHRAVAWAAGEAANFAGLPLFYPEQLAEGLEPWTVAHRYYFAKNPERHNHYLDLGPWIERKLDALCLHESQMRLTVDDFIKNIQATGEHEEYLPFLDRVDFRPALELLIREWGRQMAQHGKQEFEYAEGFRFESAMDLT
jgi:LmbE family N-acetylglucosaminyl deacetylase